MVTKRLITKGISLGKAAQIIEDLIGQEVQAIQFEDGSGYSFNYMTPEPGWKFIRLTEEDVFNYMTKHRLVIEGLTSDGSFVFYSPEELQMFIDGAKHALWTFGIWRDGKVFVGSGSTEYKHAFGALVDQYNKATGLSWDERS